MLPVTYRLIPQSGVSTYGLNTADTPVFPDIPEHAPNPSWLRLAHDSLAINSEFRLEPEYPGGGVPYLRRGWNRP
ncbi:PipA/GogA/GtgA family type III secretion system effector [Salmonella enterica subsp. enterica serovar Montevideo]|uniref:PipA/GogA/GtgA family type III secretion system effector n=1 Tax=Salmonella montevideo TaxID=115981 RepID=A0A8E6W8P2_SALMO|nr:PipA/GogA/GtgA family type III secretion system effector [Salmonella enterica subsp. enterica serovar Montevideo]